MWKQLLKLSVAWLCFGVLQAQASPIYLNIDNISVEVGEGTTAITSNNTFDSGATIDKVIDAQTATSTETHTQSSHIWYSGGGLELVFDFGQEYDLTTLHFWNYNGEDYDVDNIDFTFFDSSNNQVGTLSILPELGSTPAILAEDILLEAPLNVQSVIAFFTGTNNEVDFQNVGFTATLSTDRCIQNPDDETCVNNEQEPEPNIVVVPEPNSMFLISLGMLGIVLNRRKYKHQ
ncbi:TPA: PEP-CTERM sorting domain-containing protein [Vibrio parahaemolyticus]|nr:PEP-CTERM sorting domain-containing protein [Vibrio parahaemolyticus]HBC3383582.1 PEP-CTERM sorting domain-containing protein [Vibrio parahaemolyticus]HBC3445572.1 PEP-CTERM sorting domain-containing protein [Vibrio parahaemolyticus]HBC3845390.1 PEP-CTERM sorting domain-containing protein [Vibrio parahaemolyticus]HBH7861969.1 PEP-CTERM sorting domain-containing protein [Vibrio parahaemolyticus]